MLVCFWMMMTFHHRSSSSISNIRSVFLHDKTQSPSIKISLFQNRGAEETFFWFWLMIYLFLVLFLLLDHDLLVPFIPSDAHDQCFFRFLHLC